MCVQGAQARISAAVADGSLQSSLNALGLQLSPGSVQFAPPQAQVSPGVGQRGRPPLPPAGRLAHGVLSVA